MRHDHRAILFTLATAALSAFPAMAQDWDELFWNPQPMNDDVILPMPCGGSMAFRRVDTPVQPNWLADERVLLGNNDVLGQEHSESVVAESIVGGLTDEGADRRYYLIGKYEVTVDQFSSITEETCPTSSENGALPAEGMSWLVAQQFAADYTEWLYANAGERMADLPGAYLRLPSEEEWEFAARGGLAVTEAVRRQPIFPMDGSLEDYVWFAGFKSCDGNTQPVGILSPNPLGLFDVLGNVQEYTATLFRMRTRERMHGQVGGAVARGGSCNTTERRVRSAARDEVSPIDPQTGRAQGKAFTGFRLAAGAAILSEASRITDINADWQALGDMRMIVDPADDPMTILEALEAAESSETIRDGLARVRDSFALEMERRNEIEGLSARSVAQAGMLAIRSYISALDARDRVQALLETDPNDTEVRAFVERAEERRQVSEDILLGLIVHAAENYPHGVYNAAEAIVRQENTSRMSAMTTRTRDTALELLTLFGEFVSRYRQESDTNPTVFRNALAEKYEDLKRRPQN